MIGARIETANCSLHRVISMLAPTFTALTISTRMEPRCLLSTETCGSPGIDERIGRPTATVSGFRSLTTGGLGLTMAA
jgi:hypothetical protein